LKNFFQRTIFGIIYLVVIIGSLLLGKYAYGTVFLIINLLALYEYYSLAGVERVIPGMLLGTATFVLAFLTASGMAGPGILMLILPFIMAVYMFALFSPRQEVWNETPRSFTGVIYVSLPISLMNLIVFQGGQFEYTYKVLLGIFILIWINDTGAYLVGMSAGKHKLFERISPKKSWEGAFGGALFTFAASWWMHSVMGGPGRIHWIMLAAIVSVFGVLGDLTESLVKRIAGQKDSGKLIPGHGGMLDRIDSVLFVMPLSAVYLLLRNL